jgi:hypothetical protein
VPPAQRLQVRACAVAVAAQRLRWGCWKGLKISLVGCLESPESIHQSSSRAHGPRDTHPPAPPHDVSEKKKNLRFFFQGLALTFLFFFTLIKKNQSGEKK